VVAISGRGVAVGVNGGIGVSEGASVGLGEDVDVGGKVAVKAGIVEGTGLSTAGTVAVWQATNMNTINGTGSLMIFIVN